MKEVQLLRMNDQEFSIFLEKEIPRYARSIAQNRKENIEEALMKSSKQIHQLLHSGNTTPNHYIFKLDLEGNVIGNVWIHINQEEKRGFLYNIYIAEEYRGKGYGTIAMQKSEEWLREKEIYRFGLHVFGHNTEAKKLYERLGFEVTGVNMLKEL
ncbi:GNAT family N-acetyltransferase [Microbacteriaceae bacterium 4G12]